MNKLTQFAVFAPLFPPATLGGGPIRTIKALVDSAPQDTRTFVYTSDRDMHQLTPLLVKGNTWSERDGVSVYYATPTSIRLYFRGLRAVRNERPDVIYLNSFFNPNFSIVPQILGLLGFWRGARVLLAPRGEFGQGALALRASKKQAFLTLHKAIGLHRRVVWHASSAREEADIRALFGDKATVLVREDETALPLSAQKPHATRVDGPLRILFVSRLNPMKGLDVLLRSLVLTSAPILLDIYGNAEDEDYVRTCERLIAELPMNVICTTHGSISPDAVREVFADGDVFVFPTAGENFGHVIAEALSVSCPVICSDLTPWSDVLNVAGGTVLRSRDPNDWSAAIRAFSELSNDQIQERRIAAGSAFDAWSTTEKGDHVFAQLAHLKGSRLVRVEGSAS
ncbi:glycosyltransferase [Cryobacterium sinapicolor]|uniref:Glycosyltransferase n=1 Tax=Cryobacterium sinapicolor TaxID=1259236 RepID=A0ABY2IV08_9MICO|nr:glycosyltransferase [Cryobacterium sinapicolor]TFC94704.1 glycosyltransferase [Cryobacterium sinapicolor]